ncbi:MAG: serine hydrolase [Ruminococcaceae bacterium]|nr:serine hydrolase [Oscillospiraceae bacterium]
MTGRKKQNIITVVYLIVAALIFGGAVYLGFFYTGGFHQDIPDNHEGHTDETDDGSDKSDSDTDYDPSSDTESDEDDTDEINHDSETETETEYVPTEPEEKLIYLLENAPMRWAWKSKVDESVIVRFESEYDPGEVEEIIENIKVSGDGPKDEDEENVDSSDSESEEEEDELVLVYPKIAFAYHNLITGESLTYNADEILYSASIIKAMWVYSVLDKIETFEKNKHDFDEDGNPLYDEDGNPLFEGRHPNYDEDGKIIYLEGEEKYNLDEIWTYDKEEMKVDGSGVLQWKKDGYETTWLELFREAILSSDNIAFAQLREKFGYSDFYTKVWQLGIEGTSKGFMQITANDCVKFLNAMYDFFDYDGKYGAMMKNDMMHSMHTVMISKHYPPETVAHKYGWDIGAFHDIAIVYDEVPYIIVIMTDYEDGDKTALDFIADVVSLTKEVHEKFSEDVDREALREEREEHEKEIKDRHEKESAELEEWLKETEESDEESEIDSEEDTWNLT